MFEKGRTISNEVVERAQEDLRLHGPGGEIGRRLQAIISSNTKCHQY